MERCTGRFFSRMKMTMPKARPKAQNTSPIVSRRWPSMPRNETDERSGSFKAASPPSSVVDCASGCASAQPAVRRSRVASVTAVFAKRLFTNQRPTDARLAFQVRIKILLSIQGSRRVILFRHVNRSLEDSIRREYGCHRGSEHASTARHIKIKRSADLAASDNLCRRSVVPESDYTPLHKTVVYSILLEGGSMMLSRLHRPCRRSRELGCFRIINNLSCALLLTPLSQPRAGAYPSAHPSMYLRAGETRTCRRWNAQLPRILRGDFG